MKKIVDGEEVEMDIMEERVFLWEWQISDEQQPPTPVDPIEKLKAFLAANPDVMKSIEAK